MSRGSRDLRLLSRLFFGGRRRRRGGLAGLVIAIAVAVLLARQATTRRTTRRDPGTGDVPTQGRVTKVVDGDTLHVEADGVDYTIRLIGVDTPESQPSDKLDRDVKRSGQARAVVVALGKKAAAFTRRLCGGKPCRLATDQANAARAHRDRYRRVLAYVFVAGPEGEVCVNEEIIRQGYGQALTRYPFDDARKAEFRRLNQEAREAKRGLWDKWKPD